MTLTDVLSKVQTLSDELSNWTQYAIYREAINRDGIKNAPTFDEWVDLRRAMTK